jgi:hypothetical protein
VGDAGAVTYRRTGRPRRSAGSPRTLTGLLAGGLVALAVALVVAWFLAGRIGSAGPGPAMLVWHGVAAVLAVLAQVQADRRTGLPAALAMGAVVVITVVVLAVQWLA